MKTSPQGRALIEAFEGLALRAYPDAGGVWTVGYGHTSAAGAPPVSPGMAISRPMADQILSNDLAGCEETVARCINRPLTQSQFDALVSFEFNTGSLRKSSIDDKINRGDLDGAMETLLLYDHCAGRVLDGLIRRRHAEKLMFEGHVDAALALAGAHDPVAAGMAKAEPAPTTQPTPVPLPTAKPAPVQPPAPPTPKPAPLAKPSLAKTAARPTVHVSTVGAAATAGVAAHHAGLQWPIVVGIAVAVAVIAFLIFHHLSKGD